MNTSSQERNIGMDVARVIATLYIIGYLHLKGYQSPIFTMPHVFGEKYLTKIFLGLFMTISGYFMANYSFRCFKTDSLAFYVKRMLRFYILFALAACILFIIGYNPNPLKLLLTLSGLSTFIAQPGTLWFMVLLMLFYLVTPFIMKDGTCSSIIVRGFFLYSLILMIRQVLEISIYEMGGADLMKDYSHTFRHIYSV